MNGEQLPVVIDLARVVFGVCATAFTFFLIGAFIGRRLAPITDPTRMQLAIVHRHLERQINATFTSLEELMVSQTQRMLDEMHSVETKLDGYVVIINASNEFVGNLLTQLKDLQSADTVDPKAFEGAVASVEAHLTTVSDALVKLGALSVPVAPAPQQPVPVPVDPVAQDTQEAAAAGVTQDAPKQA